MSKNCLAVILAGSDSDKEHIEKIVKSLKKHKISFEVRICSAHKQPLKLMRIIDEYNKLNLAIIFITVAGGTDALSGTVAYHANMPVISCPPDGYNQSCINNPPGSSNAYILNPKNLGRFVAQIFSLVNYEYKEIIFGLSKQKTENLNKADSIFRGKHKW